ncbi:MAG TPA: NAD-dependent epimerase/dehydratase family protein [bacterium]|nr:NAD-dependent epimerase/dehydratase family protein [bacterium]
MKILVTGGAGFIGSHVVDAYLEAGHSVVVVDDLSTGKKENLNPRAKFYAMDLMDEKLQQLIQDEKVEVVNHHAAQIKVKASLEDPYFDVKLNVLGSVLLLDLCRRAGVKKFIYASSGGAQYGEMGDKPFAETQRARPFSVYGASKYSVELYVDVFAQNFGLDYAILRYANVYGPRQDALGEGGVVAIFTHGMLTGGDFQIFGDGYHLRDYVYVKDVARASLLALDHAKNAVFNIGTGRGTSTLELFEALAKATGYAKPPKKTVARLGDLQKSVLDPSRAKAELKWEPKVDLAAGLGETVDYYRRTGY